MSRLSPLVPEHLSPEQAADLEALARLRRAPAPRGGAVYGALAGARAHAIEGPSLALLRSPELAPAVTALGLHLRHRSVLPTPLMEIVILTVAAHWRSAYAWDNHEEYARKAGVAAAVIAALAESRAPALAGDEELAHRYCRLLLDRRAVDEPTHRQVVERFGERGAVELATLIVYYGLLCSVLVAFEVPARGGRLPFAGEPAG
jgi:4-carboxymuconolactone decarboxylase